MTALVIAFPTATAVTALGILAGRQGCSPLVPAKSAALVGVFISVTTVPAAGFGWWPPPAGLKRDGHAHPHTL